MALSLLASNNAQTVLSSGISSTATTLTVNTGTGALFPSPVSGTSFFKLTLIDSATGTLTEIVHVTQRSGDTMTIERGQEGTAARIWSANDIAANMMTAGTLSYITDGFQPKSGNLTALANLVGVTNYLPYFTNAETMTTTALTNFAKQLIAQTDANGMISTLGLTNTVNLAANALPKTDTAAAATKLATARTINGVAFDGTANITIGGGLGQTWSDVTASRALATTYTNSTANTIAVSAYTNALLAPALVQIFGNVSAFTVNTMAVGGGSGDVSKIVSCFFLVPPGATYSISTNPSQVTIARWSEMR